VAEWLGRGLQNLVQRFESARDLQGTAFTGGPFSFSDLAPVNAVSSSAWSPILLQLEQALLRGALHPDSRVWVSDIAGQLGIRLSDDPAAALLELNTMLTRLAQVQPLVPPPLDQEAPPFSRDWSDLQLSAVRELINRDIGQSLQEIAAWVRFKGWMFPEAGVRVLLEYFSEHIYVFVDVVDLCSAHLRWVARQNAKLSWLFPDVPPEQWTYTPERLPDALFNWMMQMPDAFSSWIRLKPDTLPEKIWDQLLYRYGHRLPAALTQVAVQMAYGSTTAIPCRISETPEQPDNLQDWFRQRLLDNPTNGSLLEDTLITRVPRDKMCSMLQEHLHAIRFQLTPDSFTCRILCNERMFWTEALTRDVLRCFQYRPALQREMESHSPLYKAMLWRTPLTYMVSQLKATPPMQDFPTLVQQSLPLVREIVRSRYNLYKTLEH
jgi:hypothetical protein